jgi:DNA-binding NarL/FixJ family response regulator
MEVTVTQKIHIFLAVALLQTNCIMHPILNKSRLQPHKGPSRILIADNHAIVRIGLKLMIGNLDQRIHTDEASDGESIIAKLKSSHFDLLIIDVNMPDTESFSLSAYLLKEFPSLRIMIFTTSQEAPFAIRFLKQGIHGYLLKGSEETEIESALRTVIQGKIYIGDWLAQAISEEQITPGTKTPFDVLSNRELEVTLQILQGNTIHKIAETLHLNRSTIGTHKSRVMKKLGVTTTIELIELARIHGLVQ